MFEFLAKGDWKSTINFLQKMRDASIFSTLDRYGAAGVSALASATPSETGTTAASWGYTTEKTATSYSITWTNSNVVGGTPLAIMLQFGHGTGTGGYVAGRDFINPAMKAIFDRMAEEAWREVKAL